MARGGYRPGAGRKPGSRDLRNVQLERAMQKTTANSFVDALVLVIENPANPEQLRIDACQTLAGRLMGRVLSPAQVEKQFPNV
jgi:hypothetical protein